MSNNLIKKSTDAITFFQECRASLIFAAVTGKINVRYLQPRTPELEPT